jgi:hypothetical protein
VTLTCALHPTPVPGPGIRLEFEVANEGDEPVGFLRFEPFAAFDLRVRVAGTEVPVSQPPASIGVQPVEERLAPGERLRLATPVELRFDPEGLFPPQGEWSAWTIVHEPAPVELEATLHLGDRLVGPCTAGVELGPPA